MKAFLPTLFFSIATVAPLLLADNPTITAITIQGNKLIPEATILHRLPYRTGGPFDQTKSSKAIEALYSLGAFEQIIIEKEKNDDGTINLFLTITEKPTIASVTFAGNKKLSTKKLEEVIDLKNLHAINQESADLLAQKIKKEYKINDFHEAEVVAAVIHDKENEQRAFLTFTIQEKTKSHIRTIEFIGNKLIPSRTLRSFIQNREQWLCSFLNGAGKFDEAALEIDKQRIRALYADRGHFTAQVTNTEIKRNSKDGGAIDILFTVNEGPCFTIKEIEIAPDPEVPHRFVRRLLTLQPGDTYKQSDIHKMMESIKQMYGEYGFIDAYISPQVIPDTTTNTISITFHVDKGTKWKLNRVIISGNEMTRDNVIRRQIVLDEGKLITSAAMDISKRNVEHLSYFDRESVTWKTHRLGGDMLDLELIVKEVPTREINMGIDFGASQQDPNGGIKGHFSTDLRNMFGQGWDSGFVLKGTKSDLSQFSFHISDPYLRNNLSGQLNISYNKAVYDHWKWVVPSPAEQVVSFIGRLGTRLPTPDRCTTLHVEGGVEHISNNAYDSKTKQSKLSIRGANVKDYPRLETLLEQKLQAGTLQWVGLDIIKDTRNHRIYPNDGYRIAFSNKFALPGINKTFSFIKSTLDASWYTPLIGYDTLVLGLHGYAGIVEQIGLGTRTHSAIPYRELFHMGGQNSIRGFNYSQVGPSWDYANPLGGKKAIQVNAELIFPFLSNHNMKIHLFYDAGCAWDTPKTAVIQDNASHIKSDSFHMRHTIGIGLNIVSPQPMKISFGYKLDRNKRIGESPSEFHIGMNTAF
jgi:outer membrane protein insertion porin family